MSAKMRAVRIVAASNVSKSDLEQRLIRKGEDKTQAKEAVAWMSELNLLDDSRTARQTVESCARKGYGLARAKQALYEKQIPKELWEEALADYPDQTVKILQFLRSRLGNSWEDSDLKRAVDALLRRGHSYREIRNALEQLEADMDEVLKVVVLGRAARNGSNRKNRQPLSVMYVQAGHQPDEDCVSIIRDELNLKAVEFTADTAGFVSYRFKPQLKTLGPKYGKQLGAIREALANLDGSAAKAQLDATGTLTLALPEGDIALTAEDLLIETEQKEGFFTLTENGITVALDTTLTPELIEEGHLRELISKLQTMRKEAGFDVTDHIVLSYTAEGELQEAMKKHEAEIAAEVLADAVAPIEDGYQKEWDINGCKAVLAVKRIEG